MNSGSAVAAAASSSAPFGDDHHQHSSHHHHYEWVNNDNHVGFPAASSTFNDMTHNIMINTGSSTSITTSRINKPIRRRSRVSKKTPITLLNADAASFRSLVQQFTGCPRPSSSISFDPTAPAHGGPLNLNFQLGMVQPTTRPSTVLVMQDDHRRSYSPDYHHHVNPHDHNHGVACDDHSEMVTTTSSTTANDHNEGYEDDDRIIGMGSHNLDMVQEFLMVDQHDDFGFFQ